MSPGRVGVRHWGDSRHCSHLLPTAHCNDPRTAIQMFYTHNYPQKTMAFLSNVKNVINRIVIVERFFKSSGTPTFSETMCVHIVNAGACVYMRVNQYNFIQPCKGNYIVVVVFLLSLSLSLGLSRPLPLPLSPHCLQFIFLASFVILQ